ncbi:nuclear matrix constituent protein 1a-like [Nicotiana tomentosiformis]|uniref:nuclear matrix constituent protein 1a-like n=1 Tax=Nicotiana tomentosiformis TaxID=4098 RepID=UPI00388CEC3B
MMTDVHVSNNDGTADVISNPSSDKGKKRKGRGKTTGLSIQKKHKDSDNEKLKVIIPPDRTVAVGPGANDFVTELSVKVMHNARHDVKNWKEVPDIAKDRICAHMLDTFQLPDTQHNRDTILKTANNLYRYRRSRLNDHFKKYATKEECLQNMPPDVNEAEWRFLVEYFDSDTFKRMSELNKTNKGKQEMNHICGRKSFQAVSFEQRNTSTGKEPNLQKFWELTHMKNGHWINDASAELNDKVKEYVAEQIQEIEEDTDLDLVVNAAFVKFVGETSSYCRGQGSVVKLTSRKSMNGIQEKLQAQQKEVEEERRKRESVECQLKEVKIQLEEERKSREAMVRDQKLLKQSMMALASHLLSNENGVSAGILNIISNLNGSDESSCSRLMDDIMVVLQQAVLISDSSTLFSANLVSPTSFRGHVSFDSHVLYFEI